MTDSVNFIEKKDKQSRQVRQNGRLQVGSTHRNAAISASTMRCTSSLKFTFGCLPRPLPCTLQAPSLAQALAHRRPSPARLASGVSVFKEPPTIVLLPRNRRHSHLQASRCGPSPARSPNICRVAPEKGQCRQAVRKRARAFVASPALWQKSAAAQ
jgi:hypothetical protein